MRKIVVNRQHGGFNLSHIATVLYWEKKGIKITAYTRSVKDGLYYKCEDPTDYFWVHYSTLDENTITSGEINNNYISDRNMNRDDPDLISVVEELGDRANGEHATLEIVEIPDGIDWEIEECDGYEHISEKHRRW